MSDEPDWHKSSDAWQAKYKEMHRRAQKAEGELSRMKQAHTDAAERAFRSYIDYHLYAFLLLNCNQTLFPKGGYPSNPE